MIKALIIDDEECARFVLRELLNRNFKTRVNVVGEADSVSSGLKAIEKHQPDLVFLDIKIHHQTGFDLLKKLDEVNFEVVFSTAFDNYALKAFEFAAFGYLLKPLKTGQLEETVNRLEERLRLRIQGKDPRIRVLMESYGDEAGKMKRIVVSNMEGFRVVNIERILRLKASNNYTSFLLDDGSKIVVSRTLGEYEKLLSEHGFFRIHQSHIVNLRHIDAYLKADGGKVLMTDGTELSLSRQRKPEFVKRFL